MTREPEAISPPATARSGGIRLLDWPNVLVVLILAVFVSSFAVRNGDYWLHLASGRLIAAGEYPFGRDPFSAESPPPVWINHAWLTDWLLFRLDRALGGSAVVTVKAGLVALLAAILMTVRRRGSDLWWPVAMTGIALVTMAPRLILQPAIISFLFTGILARMLLRPPTGRLWHRPLFSAVLFALWVNLDGGFWIGLGLLALHALGSVLQWVVPIGRGDDEESESPLSAVAMLVASAAACLVSPYGWAVFSWPSDFAFLRLPPELRQDRLFQALFRRPFDADYSSAYAGLVPGAAFYLLLGLSIGSFILNTGGWRWNRFLLWLGAAAAGIYLARLVPYFAIVAAPVTVLNVQSFTARRPLRALDARAMFARQFMAGFGRFVTFLVGIGLLALAWPGRLAPDGATAQQHRRVAWTVTPDPSMVRAAQQLRTWYESGALSPAAARGFHLPLEFGYMCAWYCPQEKITFDLRMTNPTAAARVVAMRDGLRQMREQPEAAIDSDGTFTHLVVLGSIAMETSRSVFYRSDRFPLWAIPGQGWITGLTAPGRPDSHKHLRLDPALWVGSPVKVNGLTEYPELPPLTAWQRYRAAPRPVPPEAYESALWLTVRESALARLEPTVAALQIAAGIGQAAPAGPSDLVNRLWDATIVNSQLRGPSDAAWHRGPDGRLARVAPLLAIRAARRAIAANPDDYEAFLRLTAAYGVLDADQDLTRAPPRVSFNQLQQITAARLALERLPLARFYGQFVDADEQLLQTVLKQQYEQSIVPVPPGSRPLDWILESFSRILELAPGLIGRQLRLVPSDQRQQFEKAADEALKKDQERLDALRREVRRRSDEVETRAAQAPLVDRARIAAAFGLPREALIMLRGAPPAELTFNGVELMLSLMILGGRADQASVVLQSPGFHPVTVLKPEQQPAIQSLNLRTSAALGDLQPVIDALEPAVQNGARSAAPMLAGALANLTFADLGASPLTRIATCPSWGGIWTNPQQVQWQGDLIALQQALQGFGDVIVQQGLMALEQGDAALARRRFQHALEAMGRLSFPLRGPAARWLDLLKHREAN